MGPEFISPVSPTPKGVVGLGTQVDGPGGTHWDSSGLGTRSSHRHRMDKEIQMAPTVPNSVVSFTPVDPGQWELHHRKNLTAKLPVVGFAVVVLYTDKTGTFTELQPVAVDDGGLTLSSELENKWGSLFDLKRAHDDE